MKKARKKNLRDSYINPGVYLIHTYYSTLHKEKKKANERKRNKLFFSISLRCIASLVARNKKSGMIHLKTKNWYHLPSWYTYWG